MGRLTELWAEDKPGVQSDYSYITPADKTSLGAVISEDYPVKPFTPEQIDDHCNCILDKHLSSRDDGKLMFEGVQIIKQLQAELADPVFLGNMPASVVNLRQGRDGD